MSVLQKIRTFIGGSKRRVKHSVGSESGNRAGNRTVSTKLFLFCGDVNFDSSAYTTMLRYKHTLVTSINSFSANGNIAIFANNTDSGESARNELSHLKSALFAFKL